MSTNQPLTPQQQLQLQFIKQPEFKCLPYELRDSIIQGLKYGDFIVIVRANGDLALHSPTGDTTMPGFKYEATYININVTKRNDGKYIIDLGIMELMLPNPDDGTVPHEWHPAPGLPDRMLEFVVDTYGTKPIFMVQDDDRTELLGFNDE